MYLTVEINVCKLEIDCYNKGYSEDKYIQAYFDTISFKRRIKKSIQIIFITQRDKLVAFTEILGITLKWIAKTLFYYTVKTIRFNWVLF